MRDKEARESPGTEWMLLLLKLKNPLSRAFPTPTEACHTLGMTEEGQEELWGCSMVVWQLLLLETRSGNIQGPRVSFVSPGWLLASLS